MVANQHVARCTLTLICFLLPVSCCCYCSSSFAKASSAWARRYTLSFGLPFYLDYVGCLKQISHLKIRLTFLLARAGLSSPESYVFFQVMCSVFGPREVSKREDFSMTGAVCVEFKFATFSEKCRRGHQQDGQEKDLSLLLQETLQPAILLHTFPKCQVGETPL